MITLLKILIFGGASLLTPNLIDVVDSTTLLQLPEPISAITADAALEIDVSSYIAADNEAAAEAEFKEVFPGGCVQALLHSKYGVSVYFDQMDGVWHDGQKFLRLTASAGVPVGDKFNRLELHVCKEIRKTTLTWHNYEKPQFLR
jgi:hypothetical protein